MTGPYSASIAEIRRRLDDIDCAKVKLGEIVREALPVGAHVVWDRNGNSCEGTVSDHGALGRMKVLNIVSGNEYWIEAESLMP